MTTIKSLMNLNSRSALITGAGGGLGRVMAETLAELGADLILVDRENSSLHEIESELINRWGVNVEIKACDLENERERSNLISWIHNENQGLNILINNAAFVGTSELTGWAVPFEMQSIDTWRRAFEVNLTAAFHLCQGLAPAMKMSNGASIINIASIYGVYGPDWSLYEGTAMGNPAAYGASKGGLIQLTRWLATTLSPDIRVNSISPGGILRGQPKEFLSKYKSKTPIGRMGTENDFRGIIAYLASDMSSYVTGQNVMVDGGWGIW